MTKLNLEEFPIIRNSISLLAFDHLKNYPHLDNLGDISERIYGCSMFLYYKTDRHKYPFYVSASLRAALNEFVSLSEMLKASNESSLRDISIEKVNLPLFHFFKLLREVNFHLNSLKHSKTTTEVVNFNIETGKIKDEVYTLTPSIIDSLEISLFKDSNNLKHYNFTEFNLVVNWVNTNQNHWGIFHILDLALRQYCDLITSKYCR
jgi:hypothetical protein